MNYIHIYDKLNEKKVKKIYVCVFTSLRIPQDLIFYFKRNQHKRKKHNEKQNEEKRIITKIYLK